MLYRHWEFKPLNEVINYYKRTGFIVVTNWAQTEQEFLNDIKKYEKIVVRVQNRNNLKPFYSNDDCQKIRERNQEYLHRLYTIKLRLGLYERTYE
jgi:hypothetical protein